MIRVCWLGGHPLCWDQAMLDRLLTRSPRVPYDFAHETHTEPYGPLEGDGAVVVCPARYWTARELSTLVADLGWVLLFLTSDEESTFDRRRFAHPRAVVWTMTPRAKAGPGRWLGEGWPPDTPEMLAAIGDVPRDLDWVFAGQVTHPLREECAAVLRPLPGGWLTETDAFLAGLPRDDYLWLLARAKVAPCPSGPATPDSFRLYEALEAGCVPVVDSRSSGYWETLFGAEPPFPALDDWASFPGYMEDVLAGWPASANRVQAWWQQYKRRLACRVADDLADLAGPPDRCPVTVVVPTSPIPAHPDTAVIEQTVGSVLERLPDAEVIVVADGVRPEQVDRREAYDEYLRRLLRLTNEWGALPLLFGEHVHQANLMRAALEHVRSPLVLFVEHDTPLIAEFDFDALVRPILSGTANLIRFHHESRVLPDHAHLMLDTEPVDVEGVPLLRTAQWSQRPHLASTAFYREMIDRYFGRESRTMIEDVMHGVVQYAWRRDGLLGWALYRLYMYAPPGHMQRSDHLDGRGSDPKFEQLYAYDGPPPIGAPAPSDGRTD